MANPFMNPSVQAALLKKYRNQQSVGPAVQELMAKDSARKLALRKAGHEAKLADRRLAMREKALKDAKSRSGKEFLMGAIGTAIQAGNVGGSILGNRASKKRATNINQAKFENAVMELNDMLETGKIDLARYGAQLSNLEQIHGIRR